MRSIEKIRKEYHAVIEAARIETLTEDRTKITALKEEARPYPFSEYRPVLPKSKSLLMNGDFVQPETNLNALAAGTILGTAEDKNRSHQANTARIIEALDEAGDSNSLRAFLAWATEEVQINDVSKHVSEADLKLLKEAGKRGGKDGAR